MTRPFRFGLIAYTTHSGEGWVAKARRAEDFGFATLQVPDHLEDQLAAVPALAAAAIGTKTIKLGSYVFSNGFRDPHLVAHEAATLDLLSGGRYELGIGAGYVRSEHANAGIPFESHAIRLERLEGAVRTIKRRLSQQVLDESGDPEAGRRPNSSVPLLIGAAGEKTLRLAAREADIVSFGLRSKPDWSGLELRDASEAALVQKVEWVQEEAASRFDELELNIIVYSVNVRDASGRARAGDNIPHMLAGSADEIAEVLYRRRDAHGISYISVFEKSLDQFAPVIDRLAGH